MADSIANAYRYSSAPQAVLLTIEVMQLAAQATFYGMNSKLEQKFQKLQHNNSQHLLESPADSHTLPEPNLLAICMAIDALPQHADSWVPNIAEVYHRSHDGFVLSIARTGACNACLLLLQLLCCSTCCC
jgi:hypothetical protein